MRGFVLFVIFACTLTYAQTIRWHGSFDSALEVSQKENKPMFVVLVSRGCLECRELFATTLREKKIVVSINEKMVPVIVTKENEDYPIELLYTLEYPAIFLLSPEEVLLKGPLCGVVDAALLEKELLDER